MRVVIQSLIRGAYETIWSAEMLTRQNTLRSRKVHEGLALTQVLAALAPDNEYLVGVADLPAKEVGLQTVKGRNLRLEIGRAFAHATKGVCTQ